MSELSSCSFFSSSSSYSEDLSQTSESSVHSFFNENATAAYTHEPEYTVEQELKTLPSNDSNDSSDDDDELDSS